MRISLYSLIRDVVFIGALLFCLIYINSNVLTDAQYAILFASYSVYSLYYIWEVKKLSPFFIMMALSNVLFIGGRFWGILLNPVLTLQEGTFFDYTIISSQHMKESLYYVLIFVFFASWGYKSCRTADNEECVIGGEYNESADVFMRRIWWVVCALAMYGQIKAFMLALSQGSYISMYLAQGQDYSAGGALGKILLYISLGLSLTYTSDGTKKRYLLLFLAYSLVNILIGGRGALGALLMFFIWYYSLSHKINIVKLGILASLALAFLLWVFSFSIRQADAEEYLSLNEAISIFLHSQGISFAVFDRSRDFLDYPTLAYIQSIVPGSCTIYSLFSGVSLKPQDVSFASYMSYNLNPFLFVSGFGLGWTLLGDLYLFGGRTYLGMGLLSFIFGFACSFIERKSSSSMFCKVLVYSIFMRFVLLPRAGLNTIIPFIIYVYVIHSMFVYFFIANKEEKENL